MKLPDSSQIKGYRNCCFIVTLRTVFFPVVKNNMTFSETIASMQRSVTACWAESFFKCSWRCLEYDQPRPGEFHMSCDDGPDESTTTSYELSADPDWSTAEGTRASLTMGVTIWSHRTHFLLRNHVKLLVRNFPFSKCQTLVQSLKLIRHKVSWLHRQENCLAWSKSRKTLYSL